jgi:hypothetical protein
MAEIPDVSGVDPSSPFTVYPRGKYAMHIYDSEKKVTNAGDGEYLRLYFEFVGGQYDGAKPRPCDLNLWNQNDQAREIAQRQLAQICHAINTIGATDSTQLHHKVMLVTLGVRPARVGSDGKEYGESNSYNFFEPITLQTAPDAKAQTAARTVMRQPPPAQPASNAPWRQKRA